MVDDSLRKLGKGALVTHYTREQAEAAIRAVKERRVGHYGEIDLWLYEALEKHPIRDRDVLIYGSADQGFGPWYEAVVLAYGGRPFVIDYNPVNYPDLRMKCLATPGVGWTAVLSISTFEHSGLGRYGDALDPFGDLKAMRECRSIMAPQGVLFLAVPLGLDKVVGQWHRIYGRQRLPRLLEGWRMIDAFGFEERHLDRDTKGGWMPKNDDGSDMHPTYPEYSPILVLTPEQDGPWVVEGSRQLVI
jgi:hypothetical protein